MQRRRPEPDGPEGKFSVRMILFFLFAITLIYVVVHVIWLGETGPGERVAHVEDSVKLLIGILAATLLQVLRKK
jgi:hypothetical protein